MTPEQEAQKKRYAEHVAQNQSTEDLQDIKALMAFPAFNRYFRRRLRERTTRALGRLTSPNCKGAELEIAQAIYLDRLETAEMIDLDQVSAKKVLGIPVEEE